MSSFPQMNAEDTANLVSFLEKQKSRYQVASREITELKKSLAEIQNSDGGTASDAVQQLRNEVGTLRARVSVCCFCSVYGCSFHYHSLGILLILFYGSP